MSPYIYKVQLPKHGSLFVYVTMLKSVKASVNP